MNVRDDDYEINIEIGRSRNI